MLIFNEKNKTYEIYPFKVKYTNTIIEPNGEIIEQWATPSKEWWYNLEKVHTGKVNILEITEFQLTEDIKKRFNKIKNFSHDELAEKYILGEELPNFITEYLLGKVETLDEEKLLEYYEIH
jgi:predicted ATP-dependent Lon-type protease